MILPSLSAYNHASVAAHVVHRQVSPAAAATSTASAAGDGAVISAEDLIQTADEHWNVSGASVVAAWLLTVVVGIVIATVFSTVRGKDKWQLFYFPRVESQKEKAKKWKNKTGVIEPLVPVVDKGYFGWLTPQLRLFWLELFQPFRRRSLTQKDTEMLELIGLDGMTYLHFLRLLRWLFLSITLFAALPLTIANYYLNTNTEYGSRTATSASNVTQPASSDTSQSNQPMGQAIVDDMLVFTAANVVGNGLWVHIGFEWVVTGLVIFFVFAYSSHYDTLVRRWVELNYNDTSFRSLLITDFRIGPKRRAKDEKGTEYQRTNYVSDAKSQVCTMLGIPERAHVNGGDVTVTLTYRNMSKLSKLMEEFKAEHFAEFSRVMTAYLRRNRRQFGDGALYDSCWDRIMGNARSVIRRTDERGWVATLSALDGIPDSLLVKKERIEMEQALARCEPASESTTVVEGEITSAFVTFATTKRAYAALKTFNRKQKLRQKINGPEVQRAPRAYNIIWENLDKVGLSKRGYSWTGVFILLFVFGLNLIPLAVITLLANYEALLEYFPTLKEANETSAFWSSVFALLGGIVPPSISALFAYLLPYIVRRLNKWSGALTRGELDKTVVRQLFIWLLVFNFVFFSLMGVIWETYLTIREEIGKKSTGEIWESLGDIPAKVTKAYISQSSYWLSWYPIRALVTCVQLLQLPRIGLKSFQSFTAKTATDLHELAKPPKFEFAIEYVHTLFAMAVALVLTPLAPIVAMCSTIYFWAMTVVHYNTLIYVEDSKETDGKCWRIARNRLLAAAVIMQVLMTITIWLKTRTPTLILLAALPVGLIILVKYREGEDDLFLKVVDLISERGLADSGPIPQYEHALLRRDWMPEFHFTGEDRAEYLRALDRFKWMRPLFTVADWDPPKAKGKAKERSRLRGEKVRGRKR